MLSEEQIQQFKDLFKRQFGRELDDTEALEKATTLIELVKTVYKLNK